MIVAWGGVCAVWVLVAREKSFRKYLLVMDYNYVLFLLKHKNLITCFKMRENNTPSMVPS